MSSSTEAKKSSVPILSIVCLVLYAVCVFSDLFGSFLLPILSDGIVVYHGSSTTFSVAMSLFPAIVALVAVACVSIFKKKEITLIPLSLLLYSTIRKLMSTFLNPILVRMLPDDQYLSLSIILNTVIPLCIAAVVAVLVALMVLVFKKPSGKVISMILAGVFGASCLILALIALTSLVSNFSYAFQILSEDYSDIYMRLTRVYSLLLAPWISFACTLLLALASLFLMKGEKKLHISVEAEFTSENAPETKEDPFAKYMSSTPTETVAEESVVAEPIEVPAEMPAESPIEEPEKEPVPTASAPSSDNAPEAILKYKELLDMGVITQEEFDAKKKQLLGL